jgi:hypothetical protein
VREGDMVFPFPLLKINLEKIFVIKDNQEKKDVEKGENATSCERR